MNVDALTFMMFDSGILSSHLGSYQRKSPQSYFVDGPKRASSLEVAEHGHQDRDEEKQRFLLNSSSKGARDQEEARIEQAGKIFL
jgi:hypothetical protein